MAQQYFTDSEWEMLVQSPTQVAITVLLADKTDPISFLREVKAAIDFLRNEEERTDLSSDLIKSLSSSLAERTAAESLQGEELLLKREFELLGSLQTLKSASEGRTKAIAHLNEVSNILAAKLPANQASEFKKWLVALARSIAEAVKEEGFLGGRIGGERISKAEAEAIASIEKALSISV